MPYNSLEEGEELDRDDLIVYGTYPVLVLLEALCRH